MQRDRLVGLALGAGSGVLYGAINVLSKPVDMHPFVKGAVAYLVSAIALSRWLLPLHIEGRDWPKVLVMGLFGGGLAPVLLFYGLSETTAADAGLLLTLELVTTAALAFAFLHERYRPREGLGLMALLASAALVALASAAGGDGASASTARGVLLVLGAAAAWGLDNAVSARLVGSYEPRGLIGLKGLLGGTACLVAALVAGAPPPSLGGGAVMAALGLTSVGLSSIFFYFALRRVGAARTSAMNIATTALVGAFGGALVLGEHLNLVHAAALAATFLGAALLATARPPPAPMPASAPG